MNATTQRQATATVTARLLIIGEAEAVEPVASVGLWAAIAKDQRIVRVTIYLDGWVPNSYHWPIEGRCLWLTRRDGGTWGAHFGTYDRKRSHAKGPEWVAFSERGGRLASA